MEHQPTQSKAKQEAEFRLAVQAFRLPATGKCPWGHCHIPGTANAIRADGIKTIRGICDELNRRGIKAARGGLWYVPQVRAVLKRLEPRQRTRRPKQATA